MADTRIEDQDDLVPFSLCPLAMELEQAAIAQANQLAKERAELDWRSKKRPAVPQAPPCGLFEQRQFEFGFQLS